MFLQSIVGSILGYLLLGEELSFSFLAGSIFILIAVYLSSGLTGQSARSINEEPGG